MVSDMHGKVNRHQGHSPLSVDAISVWRLPRRSQAREDDGDEPADCDFGRQTPGRRGGVEAVHREFVRRNIVPEVAGGHCFGQQVSDEIAELLSRLLEMFTSVQERRKLAAVVLVGDARDALEDAN
jgi:hypothetical protein